VDAINPDVHVLNATIADRSIFGVTNFSTAFSGLVGALGLVSLAIATLGVYGVISYSVSRRTREFGIRLALGAAPRDIVRLVMRQGGRQLVTGLTIGIVLATVMTKAFTAAVEVVSVPLAPLLASVAFSIAIASSLALIGPVRQAMGTRPLKW
jgi:ABC-type antimicrobial peptide transport system permease subunit